MGWCCPLQGVAARGPDEVTGAKPPTGRWAGHLRDAQRPAAASQTPTAAAFHARSSPPDAGAGPYAARAHRPGARGLTWARTPTLPAGTHTRVCIRDPHSCHSRHTRTDAESPLQGPPRGVTGTPSEPDVSRRGGGPLRARPWQKPRLALVLTVVPSVPVLFQWLKQIEGTEAALTQKMLDLEREKVPAWALGGGAEGGPALRAAGRLRMRGHVTHSHAFLSLWPSCCSGWSSFIRSVIRLVHTLGASAPSGSVRSEQGPCHEEPLASPGGVCS